MAFHIDGWRLCALRRTRYRTVAEIYPTSCRTSAVGWGTGSGRIGAVLGPHLLLGFTHALPLFAFMCLVAAACVAFLPESVGTALADVLETREPGLEPTPNTSLIASPRTVSDDGTSGHGREVGASLQLLRLPRVSLHHQSSSTRSSS